MKAVQTKRAVGFHATCFVCGPENTSGIQLQMKQMGDETVGDLDIDPRFQGYDGVAHGGIVASVLDAAMVRCLHGLFGKNPITCRLETRYYHETPTSQRLIVIARLTSRRGITCWAEGELFSEDVRCAGARGVFKLI